MSFVAVAIGGAGLLSAGASIYGANKQSDAAAQAAALQQQQMARNQQNMDPFIRNGQGANNLLSSFYGLGGDPALGKSALERFYQSPDYQFALKAGGEAVDNSAAARGGMISGNQMLAQQQFGQGLATQNLSNYLSRLSGMSGQGIQAGGAIASPNTTGANNAGNSIMGGATAQMAGASGVAGAFNSTAGNLLNNYNMTNNSSFGGNGVWGGSSASPLPGLSSSDYGVGY